MRFSQFLLSQEAERDEQQKSSTGFLLVSLFILLGTPAPEVVISTQRMGLWAYVKALRKHPHKHSKRGVSMVSLNIVNLTMKTI